MIARKSFPAAIALVMGVGAAHAAPVGFVFDAVFEFGPLAGETFPGFFTIDGDAFTQTGVEVFTPDAAFTGALLAFEITIEGATFGLSDDVGFPVFPSVVFDDGFIVEADYAGVAAGGEEFGLLVEPGFVAVAFSNLDGVSFGFPDAPAPIPLPAGGMLLLGGLAGLIALRRARAA